MVKIKKLVLQSTVMGMTAKIATIKIGGYARHAELKSWTDLVCGQCKKKPQYHNSYYECECGAKYTSWQKLLRVKKGTTEPVEIPKLTTPNEVQTATIYTMPFEQFSKYIDAMDPKEPERFIATEDDDSRLNLFKLLVAQEMDKIAIILTWNDTNEQKIALLTTTVSGRVVLRFILPTNLVQLEESLKLDKTALTEKDIEEARMFLRQVAKATEKTLEVEDYRIGSLDVFGEPKKEKVEALQVIMTKARKNKKKKA